MRSVLGDSLKRLLGFSIIPGILSLIFLFFIPETPKYLMITKRNRPKALKSLNYFQGKKTENDQILNDFMKESTLDDHTKRSSLKEVLSSFHLRFAVLLACCVLVLTLPFYPVLTYSKSMFEYIKIDRYINNYLFNQIKFLVNWLNLPQQAFWFHSHWHAYLDHCLLTNIHVGC